jgi:Family of unknown function (DUF5670)
MDWVWVLVVVLVLLWVVGLVLRIGGMLIHLVLVAAVALAVLHLIVG